MFLTLKTRCDLVSACRSINGCVVIHIFWTPETILGVMRVGP